MYRTHYSLLIKMREKKKEKEEYQWYKYRSTEQSNYLSRSIDRIMMNFNATTFLPWVCLLFNDSHQRITRF